MKFETLEHRQLLAITWANQTSSNFGTYGANAAVATEIVTRAVREWETYISDFNYDNDNIPGTVDFRNNTFTLNVSAAALDPPTMRGVTDQILVDGNQRPYTATIQLDDNGGGSGWFFDQTPKDDAEFTAIVNSGPTQADTAFQASFVDVSTGGLNYNDFYRTIVHEIGHALGIYLVSGQRLYAQTTAVGADQVGNGLLRQFNGQAGFAATLTTNGGGHTYEGPADPLFPSAPTHPNDLMNAGRTVPPPGGNPIPTTRQFISDLDVRILRDAYGYGVIMPSTINTAHASLDSQTGTLLVQGRSWGWDDTISLNISGTDIVVDVNGWTERVPDAQVN